ncbi:MAG: hypothetical protein QNJ94_18705 [Alphaproteobacteria bacterium]|nr:hypothetical protein [Alphaproteobacteria bacterium]
MSAGQTPGLLGDLDKTEPPIDLREIVKELKREVETRRRVYPRWVAEKRLDKATASRRIVLLETAADVLTRLHMRTGVA